MANKFIAKVGAHVKHVYRKVAHIEVIQELAHGVGYATLFCATHEAAYASFALIALAIFVWFFTHD